MNEDFKCISREPLIYRVNFPQETKEVYFDVFYDVGTILEPQEFKEYSHVFEHYVLGVLQKQYGNVFHKMDGIVSSHSINLSLITNTSSALEHIKSFLDGVYKNPFDDPEVFRYEHMSIEAELMDDANNIFRQVSDKISCSLFGDSHPYFQSIEKQIDLTRAVAFQNLPTFFSKFFSSLRPIFVFGGYSLSPEFDASLVSLLSSYSFGALRGHDFDKPLVPQPIQNLVGVRHSSIRFGNYIRILFPAPVASSPLEERIAFSVLLNIFSSGSSSGLFDKVRKLGIYHFNARFYSFDYFGYSTTNSFLKKEQVLDFFSLVSDYIVRLCNTALPSDEINRIIENRKRRFLESWMSNGGRYESVCDDALLLDFIHNPETLNTIFDKVTPDYIQSIAQKYFDPSKRLISIAGDCDVDSIINLLQ